MPDGPIQRKRKMKLSGRLGIAFVSAMLQLCSSVLPLLRNAKGVMAWAIGPGNFR